MILAVPAAPLCLRLSSGQVTNAEAKEWHQAVLALAGAVAAGAQADT